MAPSKRRSTRSNNNNNNKSTPPPASPKSSGPSNSQEPTSAQPSDDSCPACTPKSRALINGSRKESWIECDSCNTWYHWRCVSNGEDVENIAKWYSFSCLILHVCQSSTQVLRVLYERRLFTRHDAQNTRSKVVAEANPAGLRES